MFSFALKALQQGYRPQPANNVMEQALEGGFARQRVRFVTNAHMVNASVLLGDKLKQQYFWAFWRVHTRKPQPFLWQLMVDDYELQTYSCQLVAGSLSVGERNGVVHSVSFQVRCKPVINKDLVYDESLLNIWGNNGSLVNELLEHLEQLANTKLPNALEGL